MKRKASRAAPSQASKIVRLASTHLDPTRSIYLQVDAVLAALHHPAHLFTNHHDAQLSHRLKAIAHELEHLTVYYDYRWAGVRTRDRASSNENGVFPANFPYQVRVRKRASGKSELVFMTRWHEWHPAFDTWEPEDHFSGLGDNVDSFKLMLEIQTIRFLQAYAVLSEMETLTREEERLVSIESVVKNARSWDSKLTKVLSNWPQLLSRWEELRRLGIGRVSPQVELTALPLSLEGGRISGDLVTAFSRQLFPILNFPTDSSGETIFNWRDWRNEFEQQEHSGTMRLSMDLCFPEVRVPRTMPLKNKPDPNVQTLWRTREMTGRMRPIMIDVSGTSFDDQPKRLKEKTISVLAAGTYVGPMCVDQPLVMRRLWRPPWLFKCDRLATLAEHGACLLPLYSTCVSWVPSRIMHTIVAEDRTLVHRVVFKDFFGHERPPSAWVSQATLLLYYPFLLRERAIRNSAALVRERTLIDVRLLISSIMTRSANGLKSPLDLLRESLEVRSLRVNIWTASEKRIDELADEMYDAKWDFVQFSGQLKDVSEAIQIFFEALEAAKVQTNFPIDDPIETDGGSLRLNAFLFIPSFMMEALPRESHLLDHLLLAGFHPPTVKQMPHCAISTCPVSDKEVDLQAVNSYEISSRHLRKLFSEKQSDGSARLGINKPILLNNYPTFVGKMISLIMTELIVRLMESKVPALHQLQTLTKKLEELRADAAISPDWDDKSGTSGFEPLDVPKASVISRGRFKAIVEVEDERQRLAASLKEICIKDFREGSLDEEEKQSLFKKAIQASMAAFGAPAPFVFDVRQKPAAHITPLGVFK